MERIINLAGSASFAFVFGILGLFLFFLHTPKSGEYKHYKQSRYILGTAFVLMVLYSCVQPTIITKMDTFTQFSIHMLFFLVFSWLTYSSFLSIIYTEKYKRKRFFLDGILPAILMLISIVIGFRHPHLQRLNSISFGVIFGGKCLWMGMCCLLEYRKCVKDLDNYYGETPDIKWMYGLLWVVIFVSIFTIVTFYVPLTYYVYYPIFIITYTIITFKVINYLPVKTSQVRSDSVNLEDDKEEKKSITIDLKDKMEPIVTKWVNQKKFVQSEITIKDVAVEMGTNHNYLSKYLNNSLEMTFTVWLNTLRIEESKKILLENRTLSIEEVGKEVGIPQIYNFSRWFKIVTDTTPYQFRKNGRI